MAAHPSPRFEPDPSHWKKAAAAVFDSTHFDEVRRMVVEFSTLTTLTLQGANLTVAQVAAVASRPDVVVSLDDAAAVRERVDRSATWVAANVERFTGGFGSASHRRTRTPVALQAELIRFLNAGVVDGDECLPSGYAKTAMLVRTNTLMQGYSGIRWEILDAMVRLMNHNLLPKLPLRGSITASGDLLPLAYIAGLLIGRRNSKVLTPGGEEIDSIEALKRAGIPAPFELQAKEGIALVNGTTVGSAVAATVCYEANILAFLAVVLSAMFCEAMRGKPEFTDPLTHQLKHHAGQIEAASVMEFLLQRSESPTKPPAFSKSKQDRYALRTSPQWLGPQIEVIRAATHSIEREINSVNDNPLIDVSRNKVLYGGNFQGTPIGVSMDNLRLALAAIGKLVFAQFTELVNDGCNNGLPSNLSAGADPTLDYGLKGAEIAMAAYCSELQYLANPVTTHVQSAEQHNQDVNSLGLISARKSAEAVNVLKLMTATYMVALCQAIDLRHLEELLRDLVKKVIVEVARKSLPMKEMTEGGLEKELLQLVESQPVFAYVDDPGNSACDFVVRLRDLLLEKAIQGGEEGILVLGSITKFQEELKGRLGEEVKKARQGEVSASTEQKLINKCSGFPVYRFVKEEVGSEMLVGEKEVSPGEFIEKVHKAMRGPKLGQVLVECMLG